MITTTYVHGPAVRAKDGVRRLVDSDRLVITFEDDHGSTVVLLATDAEWDAIMHAVNTFRAELKGMAK